MRLFILFATVMAWGFSAQAAVVPYFDRAAFEADHPGYVLEDFVSTRETPTLFGLGGENALNSLTDNTAFAPGDIGSGYNIRVCSSSSCPEQYVNYPHDIDFIGNDGSLYLDEFFIFEGGGFFRIDFDMPVTAFGMNVTDPDVGVIYMFDIDNPSNRALHTQGQTSFIGANFGQAVSSVGFFSLGGHIDDVLFYRDGVDIPAPAMFAIFALALGGLAVRRRQIRI